MSGPAALAWVGGTGLALLAVAAVFYLGQRLLRRQEATERASRGASPVETSDDIAPTGAGSYREPAAGAVIGPPGRGPLLSTEALGGELGARASAFGFQLFALLATALLSQLLYVGFYLDYARYWLGNPTVPSISFDLFFWVLLVAGSVIVGSVASAWEERPWDRR